jgi:Dolichyl-phosphate-mannose-protein mannosyltransferase
LDRALARVPTWAWLTAIVVVSAAFRALLARQLVAPFIMVDELIWSEIARGIADAGEPLLRDQPDPGYSVVYPLLISPAYLLFESLPTAYAAVKTMNAVLMSLAAIPAFFVARRVVGTSYALLAAVLAVAVPSLAYTGTVMTENAFYPLFLVVILVLLVALERPTPLWVVLLLAVTGLAYATRVQAAALGPAILLTPLVLAVFERRGVRDTIARFGWLYGITIGAAVVALAAQAAGGGLLGAYEPVGESGYDTGKALRYLWWHLAELSLYVLLIPLAATIVLVARARSLDARLQAFLATTVSVTACLLPVVAIFASRFSYRIEERNMFYVVPLLCIALLAWIERGAPRPRVLATAAASVSALLVVAIPFDRFLTTSAITDTLMLLPLWSLQDRVGEDWITLAAFGAAVALGALFLFLPRRYVVALPILVLWLWLLAVRPIWWGTHGFERFSEGALFQGIRKGDRDWIDRALAPGTKAAFLWTGRTDRLTVQENEFFNRRVGPVYYVTDPTPGELPETRVRIDPKSGRVTLPDGSPVRDRFLLADSSFEPDGGELVARDKGWGVGLWRVTSPLVAAFSVKGLFRNDTWSREHVTYLRRRCRPGRLTVELTSDPSLFFAPQTVTARSNGAVVGQVRLRPDGRVFLSVPVSPVPGTTDCRVVYTVTPTAVPGKIIDGSTDKRQLGAHFNGFVYRPTE